MKLNYMYKDCFQYFFGLLMHRPKKLCALCINPRYIYFMTINDEMHIYLYI